VNELLILVKNMESRLNQFKGSDYTVFHADLVRLDQARLSILNRLPPRQVLSGETQNVLCKVLKRASLEPAFAKRVRALEKSYYSRLLKSPKGFVDVQHLQQTIKLEELNQLEAHNVSEFFQELIRLSVNRCLEQSLHIFIA